MIKKICAATAALVLSSSLVASDDYNIYLGASTGITNFGGSVDYTYDNGYTSHDYTYDVDTEDTPLKLKVGFLTRNDNRWGFYYKQDNINYANSIGSGLDITTYGLDGQIGFSSLKNDIVLPYIGWGIGFGSADEYDDTSVLEFDLSIGVNYTISNFELSTSVYRRAIALYDADNTDSTYIYAFNGIEIGAGFKF